MDNQPYGTFKPGDEAPPLQGNSNAQQGEGLSIAEPLTFWIGMLLLSIIIELVIVPLAGSLGIAQYKNVFNQVAGYIVYLPGSIIIPLLVSLWLGERIGVVSKGVRVAYRSIINAIYMSLVYLIAIFIIFLIAKYTSLNMFPTILPNLSVYNFTVYLVAIPIAIIMVLTPLLAMLSAARHK
ncbi:MAG: hypothetical protein ACP5RM_03265 [Candidatus Micrarchaeia archaeon]